MSTNIPKRKRFSSDFKRKVALDAIKETKTIQVIASEYGIHPTQVSEWKKQAIDGMDETFGAKRNKSELKRVEKENEA